MRQEDHQDLLTSIAQYARLLARCRTILLTEDAGVDGADIPGSSPPDAEVPFRATTTLYNLARGRALLYDRKHLEMEDLGLVAHVALSSMPYQRARLLRALIENG